MPKNRMAESTISRIISTGSNNYGTYIKFDNGILICSKHISLNLSMTKTFGSMYETDSAVDLGNWAHAFISAPQVYLQVGGNCAIAEAVSQVGLSGVGEAYFMRPTSATNLSVGVNVLGIGYWK